MGGAATLNSVFYEGVQNEAGMYVCGIGGCTKQYKAKGGFLKRHIATVHWLTARFEGREPQAREPNTTLSTGSVTDLAAGTEAPGETAGREEIGLSTAISERNTGEPRLPESFEGGLRGADDSVKCIAEGDGSNETQAMTGDEGASVYLDGQGKRLIALGIHSETRGLLRWSRVVVPEKCIFDRCGYPSGGLRKTWKTWQNHCSTVHGWNIASGVRSRKRAGKGTSGEENTAETEMVPTVQTAGASTADSPNRSHSEPLAWGTNCGRGLRQRTSVRGQPNQATEEAEVAPPRTRGAARRAVAKRDA